MCGLNDWRDDDEYCLWCGAELPLDGWTTVRRFCSTRCNKHHNRHAPKAGRKCLWCGGEIDMRKRLDARHCCTQCAMKSAYVRRVARQSAGEP